MKKYYKFVLCGAIFAVIAQIAYSIGSFVTMGFYKMPEYFPVWSKLMMPNAGPPPASFFAYSLLFNFISGLLVVAGYYWVKNSMPGEGCKKGFIMDYSSLWFRLFQAIWQ